MTTFLYYKENLPTSEVKGLTKKNIEDSNFDTKGNCPHKSNIKQYDKDPARKTEERKES